jgi:alkanesulfonate monooxygenase SsuD/methylene tetrahydromethanopterin reductase-like flavin-dependent oxidoreductase (luciferase family)
MLYALELAGAGATAHPRTLAELARLAEVSGWDGVFLEDYIVHHSARGIPTTDPWVALAAMAASTSRVRLGTEVTPLSRRRPWKVAREVATLDHLSDGRVILGVGLGDTNDPGYGGVGEVTATRVRAELLDESLEIIAGLWTGKPFSFSGRHYRVDEMTFLPRPLQTPRVPIWIGGGWPNPGVKKRAPRWDGVCAYIELGTFEGWEDQSPAYVAEVRALVERERDSIDDYAIVTGGRARDDDWDRDREIIAGLDRAGATWWVEYVPADVDMAGQQEAVARGPLRPA